MTEVSISNVQKRRSILGKQIHLPDGRWKMQKSLGNQMQIGFQER